MYNGPSLCRMPPEVLETFIHQYIKCQDIPEIQFAWQGGEPTLLGIKFFRSAVALQKKYAEGKKITNTIQTNGTLLSDDWCRFLKKHNFLVGLSIDGPKKLHDRYRTKGKGRPTFEKVMSGAALLKKHKVSFNTLTVLNDYNSSHPIEVYKFLKRIGDGHMQFIPAIERLPDNAAKTLGFSLAIPPYNYDASEALGLTNWSVSPKQLAHFYISIFDEWIRNDVGRVFVQFFDVALGNWLGAGSGLCQFSQKCGMGGALEHNGDLYSCDHYVYPEHRLGNIMETPLSELMASAQQQKFGSAKLDCLPEYCKTCEVRRVCHGDCLKHRFVQTADGETGLSYLCSAYKEIFKYLAPYLDVMAGMIRSGRAVPDIMNMIQKQDEMKCSMTSNQNAPCKKRMKM